MATFTEEKRQHILRVREQRAQVRSNNTKITVKKRIRRRNELDNVFANGAQALVVSVKGDALAVIKTMFPFLMPGMPFAIYSEYTTVRSCSSRIQVLVIGRMPRSFETK